MLPMYIKNVMLLQKFADMLLIHKGYLCVYDNSLFIIIREI